MIMTINIAKRASPDLKESINKAEEVGLEKLGITLPSLSSEEFIQFKIADILEMFEFGLIERFMGNRLALPIIEKTIVLDGVVGNGIGADVG